MLRSIEIVEVGPRDGLQSEPDVLATPVKLELIRRLVDAGVRSFKGVARSRVYHFMGKSTGRVVRNDGRGQFMRKWGESASRFVTTTLRRGERFTGPLPDRPLRPSVLTRLRGLWS